MAAHLFKCGARVILSGGCLAAACAAHTSCLATSTASRAAGLQARRERFGRSDRFRPGCRPIRHRAAFRTSKGRGTHSATEKVGARGGAEVCILKTRHWKVEQALLSLQQRMIGAIGFVIRGYGSEGRASLAYTLRLLPQRAPAPQAVRCALAAQRQLHNSLCSPSCTSQSLHAPPRHRVNMPGPPPRRRRHATLLQPPTRPHRRRSPSPDGVHTPRLPSMPRHCNLAQHLTHRCHKQGLQQWGTVATAGRHWAKKHVTGARAVTRPPAGRPPRAAHPAAPCPSAARSGTRPPPLRAGASGCVPAPAPGRRPRAPPHPPCPRDPS